MGNPPNPRDVAVGMLDLSPCRVQMAAVLSDSKGIFSAQFNYGENGLGFHAEQLAIANADPKRLAGAKLTVAGRRKKSGNWVLAKPCNSDKHYNTGHPLTCLHLAKTSGIETVEYTTKTGDWEILKLGYVPSD